jgi:hypothetical protein
VDGWTTEVAWSSSGVAVWEVDGIHLPAGQHLFKHAPALGDTLADAAVGWEPRGAGVSGQSIRR